MTDDGSRSAAGASPTRVVPLNVVTLFKSPGEYLTFCTFVLAAARPSV